MFHCVHTAYLRVMNESKAGPIAYGNETENTKRTVTLTERTLMCKIERLQKERRLEVNQIKGLILSLRDLMKNASQVQLKLDFFKCKC